MVATFRTTVNKPLVYVGMSGGVDSSVTAAILKEAGFRVKGVYLRRWSLGKQAGCTYQEDLRYVEATAKHLNIPYEVWDKRLEYKKLVLDYFIDEYKQGRTPNPDMLCNVRFKFGVFLKQALEEGADYVATGHYARLGGRGIEWNGGSLTLFRAGNHVFVYTGIDPNKDQSYFLARLTKPQIQASIMPLGWLTKPLVRKLAKYFELPTAERKDSQGICFLGKIDLPEFLRKFIRPQVGQIVDVETGRVLGTHNGVWFYTIGQRQGLGIGGAHKPYYVVAKDTKRNILYVAQGRNNKYLISKSVVLHNVRWAEPLTQVWAVIRYRGNPIFSYVEKIGRDTVKLVTGSKGQHFWAPAPGQFAVLYSNNFVGDNARVKSLEEQLHSLSASKLLRILLNGDLINKLASVRLAKIVGSGVILRGGGDNI